MAQNSQDVNSTVQTIEQDAAAWLAKLALSKLVIAFPVLAGWLSGPVGWILTVFAGIFIHYADLLSYLFVTEWQTSQEAKNYENAASKAAENPNDEQARKDAEDAFDNLFMA